MEAAGTKAQGLPGPQSELTVAEPCSETLYRLKHGRIGNVALRNSARHEREPRVHSPAPRPNTHPLELRLGEYTAGRRQGILLAVFSD